MQTARGNDGFSLVNCAPVVSRAELSMYRALREAIPIIDAAIEKIVRLCGGVVVTCRDKTAEKMLNDFLASVPTGPVSFGIESFIASTVDRMLTYGTAVNEMVLDGSGRLCALYGAALENVELRVGKNPLKPEIFTADGEAVRYPERVLLTALSPEPDSPYGNSLLRGLPFVSEVLLKIYSTIGTNFERLGNMRFAVTYRPSGNDAGLSENRADEIAAAWSEAMRDTHAVKDFVAVGDVDIKVIGGDATLPEIEVPIRALTEQIIAKTGLPPFLLGLTWSTTERMSSQQADILTSELEYYRTLLTPAILKICRTFLRSEGFYCDVSLDWNNISLQDEVTLAKARLLNAQADKTIKETEAD